MPSNIEIVRKFLVKQMYDISKLVAIKFERYYLYLDKGIEIRIQHNGNIFELERKVEISDLTREGQILEITENEFNYFKTNSICNIIRDCYLITENPRIELKIYHGKFEGLVRAEVDFKNIDEAKKFKAPEWFGKEITSSPLGRDGKLINLSEDEFKKLL